jgi:hypothetical protein
MRNDMTKALIMTGVAISILALSGCGKKPGEEFIGKWESQQRKETVEITRNGDGFVIADTAPNFFSGAPKTTKLPATYLDGVLLVSTELGGSANVGYDKAHDMLLMPTMGGNAELARVK